MDDVELAVQDCLLGRAEATPEPVGLLAGVTARSARLRRRRRFAAATTSALAVAAVALLLSGPLRTDAGSFRPAQPGGPVTHTGSARPPTVPARTPSGAPAAPARPRPPPPRGARGPAATERGDARAAGDATAAGLPRGRPHGRP
jgi:hypothetical protein